MRRIFLIVSVLVLSGCSSTEPVAQKGEVISCESVTTDESVVKGITLECVDGSPGAIIESLRGPMILNVWGSWCSPCRKEATELEELYLKNKDSGVQFIGINIRDSKVSAEKFVTNYEITYPNIFDRDGILLLGFKETLPANAIPSTVLIDKNGLVAARQLGPIDRALIQGFISSLVEE